MSREITKTVYSFNELSKEAQAKAIEKHSEFLAEVWECDWILDNFIETANEAGFDIETKKQISYSGFGSQGDGASFVCDSLNLDNLGVSKELQKFIDGAKVVRGTSNYVHEKTCKVHYDICDLNSELTDEQTKQIEAIMESVEQKRLELCKVLYNDLYKDFFECFDKESTKENIIANEYEFYADGTLFVE